MDKFTPKKREKEVISIRIATELLAEIDEIASKNDISRNEFIIQCIEFAVSSMEGSDQ